MINQDKVLEDILEAIKENDLTRHELEEMGYTFGDSPSLSDLANLDDTFNFQGEYES